VAPKSEQKPAVLMLHNRYREPGGEERAVTETVELLSARGHEVELIERSSKELATARGRLRAGAAMLAGGLEPGDVRAAVERTGAEIAHAHNINPLLGPRALAAARDAGAKLVMHLHNYRLFCAVAVAYRDGGICTRCHKRNTLPGVRLRCRGNLPEAAVYGAGLSLQQKHVLELVDRFIVPSRAAAERLADFGMPPERLEMLPNFLVDAQFAQESHPANGKYALFAGRLTEEKGVDTAIEAARRAAVPLLIAGSGPDADRLRRLASDGTAQLVGRLSPQAIADARRRAAFAVVPSRWDEPCPYAAIEAMAAGLPVLGSQVGGLPEMLGEEATIPARAVDQWAGAMGELWRDREARRARGAAALQRARELFGADRFYSGLMEIYERAQHS
jgi:glycosyltransferase involved in cell wall biosynthesis